MQEYNLVYDRKKINRLLITLRGSYLLFWILFMIIDVVFFSIGQVICLILMYLIPTLLFLYVDQTLSNKLK